MAEEAERPVFEKWFVDVVGSVRSQGIEVLWDHLDASGRSEFRLFHEIMRQGWEAEKAREWAAAEAAYERAMREHPPFSDIAARRLEIMIDESVNRAREYYNRGVRALKAKRYGKAIDMFLLALEIDPKMKDARYNLALAYKMRYLADPRGFKEGLYLAEESLNKLLEIDPDHEKALAQKEYLASLK